ncbi:MAG: hypothetical protein DRN78_04475, partial [Thermoproteota archaeon]
VYAIIFLVNLFLWGGAWFLFSSPLTITMHTVDIGNVKRKVLIVINEYRAREGLPPLTWDDRLAAAARIHAKDMLKRSYLSHYTKGTEEGPMERVRKCGFKVNSSVGR